MIISRHKHSKNQDGVVAIIVVVLIMLILTLIVLAISQNATKEQRQTLDRQLNSQAFYAAESGINEVYDCLRKTPGSDARCNLPSISTCSNGFSASNNLDSDGVFKYSCVLYDKSPPTLEFSIPIDNSEVVPIEGRNPATGAPVAINRLTFSWKDPQGTGTFSGCNTTPVLSNNYFPTQTGRTSCHAGILRIDLISVVSPTRSNLINNNFTAFLVPMRPGSAGTGSLGYNLLNKGVIGPARCTAGGTCAITITGFSLPAGQKMYLHMRSIYNANSVTVSAAQGGAAVNLVGAQALIDSTGKANDIIKRLEVRVPLNRQYNFPEFSIQSGSDICKLYDVTSSSVISGCGD